MQSPYVSQIPIPAISNTGAIDHLVEQILAAKAADARADVRAWEREIDERVYALYGLRPDEIRMIEESVRDGRAGGAALRRRLDHARADRLPHASGVRQQSRARV